ncbi:MAG TPA: Gfo/Idh/MocA family oxidoreductase [Tepidisphaeraceae bacterium]|nr:Gfo/Idh/MocA family oxidoreductase [Tepidisphaeraceae bacterium]
MRKTKPSRRRVLKGMATAIAAPYFVPARVLGKDGAVAPSNQVTLGVIGYGNRARSILPHFLRLPEVRCIAASDVQAKRLDQCKQLVDGHYKNADLKAHPDFRELLGRGDVQAVFIATGNRWHGMGSIMAMRAGKDVYSEKPICLTIEEGRAIVNAANRTGAIYQAGHQRRSVDSYRFVVECVRKGLIGKLTEIEWQCWTGTAVKPRKDEPVPAGLDWDMWLGQTPWHEYNAARMQQWQLFYDTAEGWLTDMGVHYTDIAQWGNDSDHTGPVEFEGSANWDPGAMSDTPITGEVTATYADGVRMRMIQKGAFGERYIKFTGDKGHIRLDDHTDVVTAEPREILRRRGAGGKSWADTGGHIGNWLNSIKTRQPAVANPETAFRATAICLILNICLRLGRKVKWDPVAEKFVGDEEANRMLSRAVRGPWRL